MSLRQIFNAGKTSQNEIIKRINMKYGTTEAQQTNQFIEHQYTDKIIKCMNDDIISFYNTNIREEAQHNTQHQPEHHHSQSQDSVIEIILEGQCYEVPFLNLPQSSDHFQMFINDICHKTGRNLTHQGINKIIENLKKFSLQKQPRQLQESNCLKVSTFTNEDKSKTAISTIHCSKVQKTNLNKQNIKVSRPSYQDAAKSKKQVIAKSKLTSSLPRSRVQVTGITF